MAATRAPGGAAAPGRSISSRRLTRRTGGNSLGFAARSGRRDGLGADSSSSDDGRLVDADMETLRRRIREAWVKAAEEDGLDGIDDADDYDAEADAATGGGGGLPLPTGWTELERRHHRNYVAGVRCAVFLLEVLLVGVRPGLGAGVLALLFLGVPASLFIVCAQLIQTLDSVSSE